LLLEHNISIKAAVCWCGKTRNSSRNF